MEFILFFSYAFFIISFYVTKTYKSFNAGLFIILFIIFIGPVVYYSFLNGTSYKVFSENAYNTYMKIGIFTNIYCSLILLLTRKINSKINFRDYKENSNQLTKLQGIIFLIIFMATLSYILINIKYFPIYAILQSGEFDQRIEQSGSIQGYHIMSTFMFFIVPAIFFYVNNSKASKFIKFLSFITTIFILVSGGNKGILLFFILFIWIYIFKYKINIRLVLYTVVSFIVFALFSPSEDFITSALRRFLVTQGAGLIARIELVINNININVESANALIFQFIYGTIGGAHPTFVIGNFILEYGLNLGILISCIVIFIVIISGALLQYKSAVTGLAWLHFSIIYLMGMSGYAGFSTIYRLLIIYSMLFVFALITPKLKSRDI
ncbi:hypothetical protein KFV05_04345 [Macrococcoides canis]|uniref:hypothetical protein n=1 Tax=Macrococcoides canis TaxID=1855823 RepID=UPI0020B86CA2|nr:hypothetical protein [Macrococcus canis]UTH00860.1 hypothetical protein KFV04_04160 [Macrococcus canis]UTH03224.1 hypothetical protein KFV05_04345 [Macrococcus canis]